MQNSNDLGMKKKLTLNSFNRFFKKQKGILIGFLALCVVLSIVSPYFLTAPNLSNVLRQISTNAIITFGMTFVIIIGGIDLSVGAIMALTGIVTTGMISDFGMETGLAILIGMSVGTGIGIMNGLIIAKAKIVPFIMTLSTASIARGFAYIYSGGRPIRVVDEAFNFLGSGYIGPIALPIVYMMVIFGLLCLLMYKTRFGRHCFAIGGNRVAARFSGINIAKAEIIIYSMSGFLAAFSGVIISARMFTGQPTVGQGAELDAIAATVIGGTSFSGGSGAMLGVFLGALIIGVLNNGLNLLNVDSFWQEVVKGLVILFAVLFDTLKNRKSE
jgi:ribose transport system permease protein